MPHDLSLLLRESIEREVPHLRRLTEEESARMPAPDKWSSKEELGHLIDSAANNHLRFVVASVEGEFRGQGYAQDLWVRAHGYRDLPWNMLVELWYHYNLLIAHLVDRIPAEQTGNRCVVGWGVQTLGFLIEDYVLHMQHHLDHLLSRDVVTAYPAVPGSA